jgi:hypothetical protein
LPLSFFSSDCFAYQCNRRHAAFKHFFLAYSAALTPNLSVSLKVDLSHTSIINAQQPIVPKNLPLMTFDRITPDKVIHP